MHSYCDSSSLLRLLNGIHRDAIQLKGILSTSTANGDLESLEQANRLSDQSPLNAVANLDGFNAWESPHFTHYHQTDSWRAENLMRYSAIQRTLSVLKSENSVSVDLVSTCQELVLALRKLLRSLNIESITYIADEYEKICEENAIIRAQNEIAFTNRNNSQILKSSNVSDKLDLNRTEVFEAIERVCTRIEDEKDAREADLRNTRFDLERAQESLEVNQKIITHLKNQLESERKRSAFLESTSSEILSHVRDLASGLNCSESASTDLQVVQSLSRRVNGLLSALPWLRSWMESDATSNELDKEINPYHLLQSKESELNLAKSSIEQLANEMKDVKSEKSHLSEELENKNHLIQRLQGEIAEKTSQIDRYRATFDELFEPKTAADFARQVAERYNRHNSSGRSKNSSESLGQVGTSIQASQQNLRSKKQPPMSISSRLVPEKTSSRPNVEITPVRHSNPATVALTLGTNKEVTSEERIEPCHPGLRNEPEIPQTSRKDELIKESLFSPILAGAKRSRPSETPKHPLNRIGVCPPSQPNPMEARRTQLPRQSRHDSKPLSSQYFLSSGEKHDPACATS
ncbi:hypothetical protein Aperf_G00000035500 [Anoplocephala perfoliata]